MKRKFTLLIAAFALLTMIVQPGKAWGQASVGTTMWAEDFSYYVADDVPTGSIPATHTGTTIYNNGSVTYSVTNGNGTTKIYAATLAGGTSPELLVAKGSGTWTIEGIPTGGATELTLTYKTNNNNNTVSSTTDGVTITEGTSKASTKTFTIEPNGSETFTLVVTNSTGSNTRVDDFSIVVKTAGGSSTNNHTLTFGPSSATYGTVTVGSLTSPATVTEGATLNITATSNLGFVFSNWSVTGTGSSVDDATSATTTFTMGTADATLTANYTQTPTYTITYYPNVTGTAPIEMDYNGGEDVTIANNTFTNPGYAFTKWNTAENGSGNDYMPGDVIYGIDDDIDLYAQWEASDDVVDVLNWAATGSPTNYTDWTYTAPSGTAYKGQSSGNATGQYIQLRSNGNNSGIVTTTSIGNATKVVVTWNSTTYDGRTLNIYGKNTAYTAATDLYGNDAGDLLGTIVCGTSTELNITGSYAFIGMRSASAAMYLDEIDITWNAGGSTVPSFTIENNDEIAYDATEGSFTFTLNNPVTGGTLSVSEEVDWISDAAISALPTTGGNIVNFNTTVNNAGTSRSGVITLTYSYDNEIITKDVTVTQDGNPDATMTIAEVREQGTGSVVTKGIVTSYAGTTGYIQDNDAAICVYGSFIAAVGDEIRVSGSLSTYNGLLEITNPQVTVISSGNTVNPELMTVAEAVASTNQGWYIRIENALVTAINDKNVTIKEDESSIVVRFNNANDISFAVNDIINLYGNIGYYNGNQIANPQNVEVQQPTEPTITLSSYAVNVAAEGENGSIEVTFENFTNLEPEIQFFEADGETPTTYNWMTAELNAENDYVTYQVSANDGDARVAYFKVYEESEGVYSNLVTINQAAHVEPPTPGEWVLTTLEELTEDDIFVITGTNANGTYAMANDNGTQSAPAAVEVTVSDETLSGEIAANIQWNMTYNSETGYTFYPNGDTETWLYCTTSSSNNRLRVGTNTNNAFNLDAESGYIKYDSYYIGIYDSQDWRGYTSINSNIANQTFAFYKKVDPTTPKITVTPSTLNVEATVSYDFLTLTLSNLEVAAASDFNIQFYDASGEEQEMPEWCVVRVTGNLTGNGGYSVACVTVSNPGAERAAYFKVFTYDAEQNVVYSNLVTINQASDPTYAVLPFEYDNGGGNDIEAVDGLYCIGINSYDESPKMDFFRTDSWLLLQFQETPGTLSFDIKGVEFSGGTFTVMTSADGETYTVLATYTQLGDEKQSETFNNLGEDVRFIKWVYTEQVEGDVALGNINLSAHVAEAYNLTVEPFENLEIFTFVGDESEMALEGAGTIQVYEGDHVMLSITANEGYRISSLIVDDEEHVNDINDASMYLFDMPSHDVTISATAVEIITTTYTLANSIESGRHYIITNGLDKAMGGQNNNNRAAVEITIEDFVAQVSDSDVAELVISGPDAEGLYTIYDANYPGYLYAASSGSNHLKTRESNSDGNSQWTIEFDDSGVATIKAQGNYTRNCMRYNSSNDIFSCYGENNNQADVYLYMKDDDDEYNFYSNTIVAEITITEDEMCTVHNNVILDVTQSLTNEGNAANLLIEDGAQLKTPNAVHGTMQKNIVGFGEENIDTKLGYYLLRSPVPGTLKLEQAIDAGMVNGSTEAPDFEGIDLYDFNQQKPGEEWQNERIDEFFASSGITANHGYLYANVNDVTLAFATYSETQDETVTEHLFPATTTEVEVLAGHYNTTSPYIGWELIGNPFTCDAYLASGRDFYRINATGDAIVLATENLIKPCEGIFVVISENDPETWMSVPGNYTLAKVHFTTTEPVETSANPLVNINVSQNEVLVDNARIRFSEGESLRKMTISDNAAKVYIPQGNIDYSVVHSQAKGIMPINFKVSETGTYTISTSNKGIEFTYLHLIDNVTGEDIDLLLEPEYTFTASVRDPEARFLLVFNGIDSNIDTTSDIFVYQNGDEIIVSGTGTLQVYDVMGRFVRNININGTESFNASEFNTGVYIFRMVGETVKTQKIVVR